MPSTAPRVCPHCDDAINLKATAWCARCRRSLAPVALSVFLRGEPSLGAVCAIQLQVHNSSEDPLTAVYARVAPGQKWLGPDSVLETPVLRSLDTGPWLTEDLGLQMSNHGTLPIRLQVGLRDPSGNDQIWSGRVYVDVSAPPGDTTLTDVTLIRSDLSLDSKPKTAPVRDWQPIELRLEQFRPWKRRLIDVGEQVDRYRLERLLGNGAFGTVFLASRAGGKGLRYFALKTLRRELVDEQRHLDSFEDEVDITRRLNHDGLVRMFDYGYFDSIPYLVMEYLEGPTASTMLAESGGGLDPHEVATIGISLAEALAYAHNLPRPVFHRDIKPANIQKDRHGRAKLTDFNLAWQLSSRLTSSDNGALGGSPDYQAPEQFGPRIAPAPTQDLWSLGVTLYELVTDSLPFVGKGEGLIYAIKNVECDGVPGAPAWLEQAILRCLRKDPAERFANARDLEEALRAGLAAVPPEPIVLVVRPDGSGDGGDLVKVVAEAPPGSTIQLGAGRHRLDEPLRPHGTLTLQPEGVGERPVVIGPPDAPCLVHDTDARLFLQGVSFEGHPARPGSGVIISNGETHASDCLFRGAVDAGVSVVGTGRAFLLSCGASHNGKLGLRIGDHAHCEVERGRFEKNGLHGIEALGQSHLKSRSAECVENEQVGIVVDQEASAEIRCGTCSNNGAYGIYVGRRATADVTSNRCTDNGRSGIAFFGEAAGTISDNTCLQNPQFGIYVLPASSPTVTGNDCPPNQPTAPARPRKTPRKGLKRGPKKTLKDGPKKRRRR